MLNSPCTVAEVLHKQKAWIRRARTAVDAASGDTSWGTHSERELPSMSCEERMRWCSRSEEELCQSHHPLRPMAADLHCDNVQPLVHTKPVTLLVPALKRREATCLPFFAPVARSGR